MTTGKNRTADDLERVHPENPESSDSKRDESKDLLAERLANSEKARKAASAKNKKDKFLLIFIGSIFFLLFIESITGFSGGLIICTAATAVLLFLWILAQWSGFRPLAARLNMWLDLAYKAAEQHLSKQPPQPEKPEEEYEELPLDNSDKT